MGRIGVLGALLALALSLAGSARAGDTPSVHAVTVEQGPVLDGLLDDAVWQLAEPVTEFTQIVPDVNAPPSQRTEIRFLTDTNYLYIAFRAWDTDPSAIVANRLERDDLFFFNDNFSFVLDTFHDHRNGYFFQVNPLGGRRDGTFEGRSFENEWNGIWDARTHIDENGWTAEVRIPYKTLSFRPGANTWGLNLVRRIRRRNEEDRWADPSLERMLIDVSRAGVLTGMSVAQQGIGLDLVPSLAVQRIDDPIDDVHDTQVQPTFDAFYKVTPSLTASLTVNNDFATAAVDNERVNLTRFALFFPEKRAFFLQDSGIFNFGGLFRENGMPFFSRQIGIDEEGEKVDLLAGLKFTGRIGSYNLGILDVQAESYGDVRSRNLGVARVSKNVLDESTVGFIVTRGDPSSDFANSLVGADFNFRSNDVVANRVVSGGIWAQHSFTNRYDGREGAYGVQIAYPNDRVHWGLKFKEIQENFHPALGFVNRTGIRQYDGRYRFRVRPGNWLRTVDSGISGRLVTNMDNRVDSGRLTFRPLAVRNVVEAGLELRYRHYFERLLVPFEIHPNVAVPAGNHHFDEGALVIDSSPIGKLWGFLELRYGSFFTGRRLRFHPRVEWRPNAHWLLAVEYEENRITLDALPMNPDGSFGPLQQTDFETRITRVRVNLAFNPNLSWNTFVQYNSVSDEINLQSRLRWIIVPGRELLVVVNQGLDTSGEEIRWGRTQPVIKLNWTLRF